MRSSAQLLARRLFVLSVGALFVLLVGANDARAGSGQVTLFIDISQNDYRAESRFTALPEGSSLIVDPDNHRVLRVAADGAVTNFAGFGKGGDAIDTRSATKTQLAYPAGFAILSDGSVLIADTYNDRVLRVAGGGAVSVFVGTGKEGDTIDPQSATNTQIRCPSGLAVLPDRSVLIAEIDNHRVLRVAADGAVSVFAGTGQGGSTIDPQSATKTQIHCPSGLAVLPDRSVLITDTRNHRVLCVAADGAVSVFAGTGQGGSTIDPQSATKTQMRYPSELAVLLDRSVLIADTHNHRVLRVAADAGVSVFIGTGKEGNKIDPQSATKTQLGHPTGIAVLSDGSILVTEHTNERILIVSADDDYQRKLQQLVLQGKAAIDRGPSGAAEFKEVHYLLQTLIKPAEVTIRSLNKEAKKSLFLQAEGQEWLSMYGVKQIIAYVDSMSGYRLRARLALNALENYKRQG